MFFVSCEISHLALLGICFGYIEPESLGWILKSSSSCGELVKRCTRWLVLSSAYPLEYLKCRKRGGVIVGESFGSLEGIKFLFKTC